MKYYYRFGYGTFEEHGEITMLHNELFTKEQLEIFTLEAYEYAYLQYKNNVYDAEDKFYLKDFLREGVTFQSLFSEDSITEVNYFIKFLEQKGFEKLTITAECFVFGWAKADEVGSWEGSIQPDDLDYKIQEKLSQIGRKK